MPHRYPAEVRHQVIELARSGTKIAQLAETFGKSDATIYNWLKQERIDRGELEGLSTDQALELAAAKRLSDLLEAWDPRSLPGASSEVALDLRPLGVLPLRGPVAVGQL